MAIPSQATAQSSQLGESAADMEKMRLVEQGRAFFCSELVAKAFKCVGLMKPTDEACSNFLPCDFMSNSGKLQLVDGATLGSERLIFTDTMFAK